MKPNIDDVVQMISIDRLLPDPDQPRKFFDEAEDLRIAASIQEYGLIQPILVRPVKHSTYDYRIVHGERRYRAHKRLGLGTIKAIVREMDDSDARDLQLLENLQRSDLSDIELAWEFHRRIDRGQTHQQIAEIIGRKRSYVTQRLSLLRLSKSDQQRMLRRKISFSQARVLVSVKDPEERRKVSIKINKNVTVKKLQSEIRGKSLKNVTRVTSKSHVNVESLAVKKLLLEEDGSVKKVVSRSQLIFAYLEDLKLLR